MLSQVHYSILISFTVFILSSCKGPLDKPILDELTMEELREGIESDSLFETTYEKVKYIKDSILITDVLKAKWGDITYARVHELITFANDTSYFNPLREKWSEEWEKYNESFEHKVDSASNYWKQYAKANSLDAYVHIELATLDKDYYSYSLGIKDVNLGFRLTPLRGRIEQLIFSYELTPKIDGSKADNYLSILDRHRCLLSRPFSRSIVRYWEADYSDRDMLESRSVESLLRDYDLNLRIEEIRMDGKNMSRDDLGIPESIESYWKYENDESEIYRGLYFDDVVEKVLGLEYEKSYEYISNSQIEEFKKRDLRCYEFLTLGVE